MAMLREISEQNSIVIPILIGRVRVSDIPEDLKGKYYLDLRYNLRKKYADQKQALILLLKAAAAPAPSEPELTIPVGDALIDYLLRYQYTGRNEKQMLPEKALNVLADVAIEALSDSFDSEDEFKEAREKLVGLYGHYALRKMYLYDLDNSNISLTKGVTEDELAKLVVNLHILVMIFAGQQAF